MRSAMPSIAILVACAVLPSAAAAAQPITISVDLTEAPRQIVHARLVVPVSPGPLVLHYPKWIPGEHGPTGPIGNLAGLRLTAAGADLAWERDPADMYTFRCTVPAGAREVTIGLDYLVAGQGRFSSGSSATTQLAWLNWNQVLLYPAGRDARELQFAPEVQLPRGWDFGTALPVARHSGDRVAFAPVSLETLIDSPVLAGQHFRHVPLTDEDPASVVLDMACDSPEGLEMPDEMRAAFRRLVVEADAMFGARHFRTYHFLLSLSDHTSHFGLEHHESSDNRVKERMFRDANLRLRHIQLLPHEFVHSWNGKHRRPADLTAPDYQKTLQTELLWVYEGLTQYLSFVLTARSGLRTPEESQEHLAGIAAQMQHNRGRTWRPLEDTAVAAQVVFQAPGAWEAWRRAADFYNEGLLVWLEADALLRERSQGQKSLDDFCRIFFASAPAAPSVRPYSFDDVVAALERVAPHDWRGFLRQRIEIASADAPLGGIETAGWQLVYRDALPATQKALESANDMTDERCSIGLRLAKSGEVADVIPGLAADRAGIGPGMQLVAVNGRKWSPDVLRDALRATSDGQALELLLENAEFFATHRVEYTGGLRYAHIERDEARPDLLTTILQPVPAATTAHRRP